MSGKIKVLMNFLADFYQQNQKLTEDHKQGKRLDIKPNKVLIFS